MTELGLQDHPEYIWNMDETSCQLQHAPIKVLAAKGSRNVSGRVGNNREIVSVLVSVNAAGHHMPPFCIVKGKTERSLFAYNTPNGVLGAKYTYQARAWMEDILGVEWFRNHFLKHCGSHWPQILLLDSHSSHESLGLIEIARENNIILFTFPPHTTHYLCPLDKTIFSPLQSQYNSVCSEFMSISPTNIVCKWEWPRLFKVSNIKNGFKSCGIYPLCPSIIPKEAFKPSEPHDTPLLPSMPAESSSPSTPSVISATSATSTSTVFPSSLNPSSNLTPITSDNLIESLTAGNGSVEVEQGLDGILYLKSPTTTLSVSTIPVNTPTNIASPSEIGSSSTSVFDIQPSQPTINSKKTNKRKLSGHRILTNDEILAVKRREKEEKERAVEEKEARRREREQKKLVGKKGKGIPSKGKGKARAAPVKVQQVLNTCQMCNREQALFNHGDEDAWVKCDFCKKWYHQTCIPLVLHPLMREAIEETSDFSCHICTFKNREY